MKALLFFLAICLSLTLVAQPKAEAYADVVYLQNDEAITGTVLAYEYGQRVIIVTDAGTTYDLKWAEVKRVNFRLDPTRLDELREEDRRNARRVAVPVQPAGAVIEAEPVSQRIAPSRKFMHQLSGNLNFGTVVNNSFGFSFNAVAVGVGFGYHLIRPLGPVIVGAGVDVSLLSFERQENMLAVTAQVEWPFFVGRRFQPMVRLEAGPSYPFGGSAVGENLSDRSISPLIHPSIGVQLNPKNDGWGRLYFDLGYRFVNSAFTITTENLDVVERRISYRRLVVRGGMRF
jgi:hypothetical protein